MDLAVEIREVAARLARAERVGVLTGAGVSAASGIPTFRGAGGLWRRFRAEDLATPEAFERDPRLVWQWYDRRRSLAASAAPNLAHHVLARWSERLPSFTLVTQNVDGLHERAGTKEVIRLHGSLWELRCARSCPESPAIWPEARAPLPELPPRCPACGGLARPGVVWFGEGIDPLILRRALSATRCDLFFSIGTSSLVYPAAALAEVAARGGAFLVVINPEWTEPSPSIDVMLRAPAAEALDAIDREARALGL